MLENEANKNFFLNYNNEVFKKYINEIYNSIIEIKEKNKNIKSDYFLNSLKRLEKLNEIYSDGINKWFHKWSGKNDFCNSLFYKRIIICEGINDEYFLNSLKFNKNIFILKSFGKYEIPYLFLLLNLFNKEIFYIYDDDIKNKNKDDFNKCFNENLEKICIAKKSKKINHFHFSPNLEKQLFENEIFYKNYIPRLNLFKYSDDTLEIKNNLLKTINDFFK